MITADVLHDVARGALILGIACGWFALALMIAAFFAFGMGGEGSQSETERHEGEECLREVEADRPLVSDYGLKGSVG